MWGVLGIRNADLDAVDHAKSNNTDGTNNVGSLASSTQDVALQASDNSETHHHHHH